MSVIFQEVSIAGPRRASPVFRFCSVAVPFSHVPLVS